MSEGDAVRVAVRVRPFNSREKDRKAKNIIAMSGPQTTITNPETEETKTFSFDFSYWSHDGFNEEGDGSLVPENSSSPYADQRRVYDDLGADVLNNAFAGYNACLFAYGQTGSGKSYSMVGYGKNVGIVPITCDEIFKYIASASTPKKLFQVTFSMLEIYNEQVRDLLVSPDKCPRGGLKVRQHPNLGVQVVGLSTRPVASYKEIERAIDDGTRHRTIASTNMNATSSRAHTVVQITFTQIEKDGKGPGKDREMQSRINLVDLAGSERAASTGATGDRLKEGAAINLSLTMLGNVINALVKNQQHPKKKMVVPYRDSKLTMILQDALGGNSKTIMICALSPADINYDETLSTLRYADRAKQIKNQAKQNIDPTEMLIKQLKEENARLKGMVTGDDGGDDEEKSQLEEQLKYQEQMMSEMQRSWEERLAAAQAESAAHAVVRRPEDTEPHFANLNEDEMLNRKLTFIIRDGDQTVGTKRSGADIGLSGLGVVESHAKVSRSGSKLRIELINPDAKLYVNGKPVAAGSSEELRHGSRVLIGSSSFFVVIVPGVEDATPLPTWETANREWASAQGFNVEQNMTGMSEEERQFAFLQEELIRALPLVQEANSISEELDKARFFEAKIVAQMVHSSSKSKRVSEVFIKVRDLCSDATWMWPLDKFMNRVYLMRELHQQYEETEDASIDQEKDPFWDPVEPQLIGRAAIYLNALACGIEVEDQFPIQDYKGKEEGIVRVEIFPCTAKWKVDTDGELFVEDPRELIGTTMHLEVRVVYGRGFQQKFTEGIFCKFNFYDHSEAFVGETETKSGTINPDFNYVKRITVPNVTDDFLNFLENEALYVDVWGVQKTTPTREPPKKEKKKAPASAKAEGRSIVHKVSDTGRTETATLIKQYQNSKEKPVQEVIGSLRAARAVMSWKMAAMADKKRRLLARSAFMEKKLARIAKAFEEAKAAGEVQGNFMQDMQQIIASHSALQRSMGIEGSPVRSPSPIDRSRSPSPKKPKPAGRTSTPTPIVERAKAKSKSKSCIVQ